MPPPSLLLAPVMWEGAGYQLSWMQGAAPPAFSSILWGIFPEMILKSACLVNLASLKMEEILEFPSSFQNSPHFRRLPSDLSAFSDCLGKLRVLEKLVSA